MSSSTSKILLLLVVDIIECFDYRDCLINCILWIDSIVHNRVNRNNQENRINQINPFLV